MTQVIARAVYSTVQYSVHIDPVRKEAVYSTVQYSVHIDPVSWRLCTVQYSTVYTLTQVAGSLCALKPAGQIAQSATSNFSLLQGYFRL